MNANKVNPENLVVVGKLSKIYIYKLMGGGTNHSTSNAAVLKLTDSNPIFRIDFVSIQYHRCEISCQIIECKFYAPYDFLKVTL